MVTKIFHCVLIISILNLMIGCKIMDLETVASDEIIDDSELIMKVKIKNGEDILFDDNGGILVILEPAVEGNTDRGYKRLPLSAITELEWTEHLYPDSIFSGSSEEYVSYLKKDKSIHNQSVLVMKASTHNIDYNFDLRGGRYVEKELYVAGYTSDGIRVQIDRSNILSAEVEKIDAAASGITSALVTLGVITVVPVLVFLWAFGSAKSKHRSR